MPPCEIAYTVIACRPRIAASESRQQLEAGHRSSFLGAGQSTSVVVGLSSAKASPKTTERLHAASGVPCLLAGRSAAFPVPSRRGKRRSQSPRGSGGVPSRGRVRRAKPTLWPLGREKSSHNYIFVSCRHSGTPLFVRREDRRPPWGKQSSSAKMPMASG